MPHLSYCAQHFPGGGRGGEPVFIMPGKAREKKNWLINLLYVRQEIGKGQMGSALMGSLQMSCF